MAANNGPKVQCPEPCLGYPACMYTPRNDSEAPHLRSLMGEALWGIGLVGGVLLLSLLVVTFGR